MGILELYLISIFKPKYNKESKDDTYSTFTIIIPKEWYTYNYGEEVILDVNYKIETGDNNRVFNNEKYLTVNDIKDILGIGINRAYELVNQPDFPKIKIGKSIRIPQSKFEQFMNKLVYKNYDL